MINIENRTIEVLKRDLDLNMKRQELVSANVANVDTPGYTARDLEFSRLLDSEMARVKLKTTRDGHISEGPTVEGMPRIVESTATARLDGNNVNIESEMLKIMDINLKYNIDVQFIAKKLRGIKELISEMRR